MKLNWLIVMAVMAGVMVCPMKAGATRTDEGTWRVGTNLMVDLGSYVGTDIQFDLSLGRYVKTGLMLGGYGSIWDNDLITTIGAGGKVQYHMFDSLESPWSFFTGADVGFANTSSAHDDAFALICTGRVGVDLFLAETVALETVVEGSVATDDIYTDDGDQPLTNTDVRIRLGFAIFF